MLDVIEILVEASLGGICVWTYFKHLNLIMRILKYHSTFSGSAKSDAE
jgi:hypothetical protein